MKIKLKHSIKGLKDQEKTRMVAIVSAHETLFPEKLAMANDMLSRTIFVKEADLLPGMINMNPKIANSPDYRSLVTPTHPL